MFLARTVMHCTVEELAERMTSAELTDWAAEFQLQPWGDELDRRQVAIVAAVLANVNRNPDKRPQPYEAADFLAWRPPPDPEAAMKKLKAAFAHRIVRKAGPHG